MGSKEKPSSVLMEQRERSVENCHSLSSVTNVFKKDRRRTGVHLAGVCLFSLPAVGIFSGLSALVYEPDRNVQWCVYIRTCMRVYLMAVFCGTT